MRLIFFFLISSLLLLAQPTIPGLDEVIETAIQKGEVPGVVCLIGQGNDVLHYKAYGKRALEPVPEAMTLDTIFDAASLTKVVATTSSILKLLEEGKVRLNDPVTAYLPKFQGGKSNITVRHLLTHYSGLRPDVDLEPAWTGHELGIEKALIDKPVAEPGARFIYSDINFILLGEIVRQLSGKRLDQFAKENIFLPLGMNETTYLPPAHWRPRIAPTEKLPNDAMPLRGVVHDPTTRYMEGVAGHAGMFTTAEDLAKFARMILAKGAPLFSPLTIAAATRVQSPPGMADLRGLGWDIDSRFSGNRGDLFPVGSFGHTGFTGTSLWIDPSTNSYVILLGNHVHPFRRTPITALRGRVASVAAAFVSRRLAAQAPSPSSGQTRTGLDVLVAERFARLANKRIGLITNHTGVDRQGRRNIDLMLEAKVPLVALFSPEHGIAGKLDEEKIKDTVDPATKLPVFSLYLDEARRPNAANLKGINTLVFDIQDIGARFYTYACTMKNAMEVAALRNLEFIVLDRPNPITGTIVEGPGIDKAAMSFVGCLPVPLRHGMTVGELARLANDQLPRRARLTVVPVENWRREMWFDETGLPWVNPSPNIRSLDAALLYPGIAMLEYSKNYSVGRGTEKPFQTIGSAYIDPAKLGDELAKWPLPGVSWKPVQFRPDSSKLKGIAARGLEFKITDRKAFESTRLGLGLMVALRKLYPQQVEFSENRKLIGDGTTIEALGAGKEAGEIWKRWRGGVESFLAEREKYLIYR
ncbi:MAG: DUF1343 domain-containing protein [Bryobacter sp.]|nr:DUF1343 domain-containing protein [Bryobacter sp.]